MMMKKLLSILMVLCMFLMMAFTALAEEPPTIVYAWIHMNNMPSDDALASVEEALSEITTKKIGVRVKLLPLAPADINQTIDLMLASGEQIDVFSYRKAYTQAVEKGYYLDITDLINEYAPDAVAQTGDDFMKCVTINGRVYGLPVDKGVALVPNWLYRVDLAEKAGINLDNLNTLEDYTEVFAQFKAAYPEMYPLFVSKGGPGFLAMLKDYKWDKLSDETGACLIGAEADNGKVVNLYESKEFHDLVTQIHEWYEAGYISPDAATTTLGDRDAVASGLYWSYFGSNAGNYFANEASQNIGYQMDYKQTAQTFLGSNDPAGVIFGINANSKNPEKALQFLNLTYSDVDVVNLIVYGICGRDYVLNEDGFVEWPEGYTLNTVPYTSQFACGTVGSQYKQYELAGVPADNKAKMAWDDEHSARSVAIGFAFDPSDVTTEVTMVTNVINQYLNSLMSGSVEVESTLEAFNKALYDAGMQNIIDAKQAQLDAFLNAQ